MKHRLPLSALFAGIVLLTGCDEKKSVEPAPAAETSADSDSLKIPDPTIPEKTPAVSSPAKSSETLSTDNPDNAAPGTPSPAAPVSNDPIVAGEALKLDELPVPIRGKDYKLVFHDEFDGPAGAKADKSRWSDWALGARKKAFNVADACKLDGRGHLAIEVRRGADGRTETGGIDTRRQFMATHGYFECRAKLLEQPGAWCAFWIQTPTMGKPLGDAATAGVEIDVFEYFPGARKGKAKDVIQHNAHWDGYAKDHKIDHVERKIPGLASEFRTYAAKWDESGYIFYVDGVETGRWQKTPVSNRPEYLILSCEADTWTGDIALANLPAHFIVDHVRVWQTPAQIEADAKRGDARRPKTNP